MKHLLDLRDDLEREAEPLDLYFPEATIFPLTLHQLEAGQFQLDPNLPYLVACEVGQKSKLAVLYLQSDGYVAEHLPEGVLGLRKQLEQEWSLPHQEGLVEKLLGHPRVRFVAVEGEVLKVRGTLTPEDLHTLAPVH